jgi:hypothetical protein
VRELMLYEENFSFSFFRWASGLALRRSDDVAPVDCTTR